MPSTIGIDTGGTFTDLVAISGDGAVRVAKHPSTPEAPMRAFLGVLEKSEIPFEGIERIVHGTTVATNAILQRTGANIVFITTAGFEDVPFIQRINRKKEYDLHWLKPEPLVRRRNCLGVKERINAQGEVVVPLTADTLAALKIDIEARQQNQAVEAIALCLLFSYINPAHELEVGRFLEEAFPHIPISLSHQVAPIWREYERSSTLLADAFVKPLIQSYCHNIGTALEDNGIKGPCSFLKSDGGTTLLTNAPERPVNILLSGLAGGIVGGKYSAETAGFQNAITLDMGGTSCDVGLVLDGEQQFTTAFEIEWGLPVAIPIIEVRTLGAGGGSIAWIDKGGMLNVGPESAGAVPGPACYGTGGTQATVTDANLVLGRLNPSFFLGGELPLYPALAKEAIEKLANRMGASEQEAATAIVEIADENMTNAIRLLTIERGIDPATSRSWRLAVRVLFMLSQSPKSWVSKPLSFRLIRVYVPLLVLPSPNCASKRFTPLLRGTQMSPTATSKRDLLLCSRKREKSLSGKVCAGNHGKRCSSVCGITNRTTNRISSIVRRKV